MHEHHSLSELEGTRAQFPEIGDALVTFESRLSRRTKVPPDKVRALRQLSEERLRQALDDVSKNLKRFAEAVVDNMDNPSHANSFLRELNLRAISRDHDWRAIFSAIREQESGYEGYKRAVVIKYLQYLSHRKGLIEYIHASRYGLEDTDANSNIRLLSLSSRSKSPQTHHEGAGTQLKFVRLPLGELVECCMRRGNEITILMAAHAYRLTSDRPPLLTDQNGVSYLMKQGRNLVGRHPEGEVVVDQNFTDVSRFHLIIEWDGTERIRLTDFSSGGSYVNHSVLAQVI